ncbi:S-layer homology domain-containing protein [Inediibacterium massiliense]|uniref:S-layer homology domain-containing protein n=1 Tax=Inediibacterium massiliense TaxID=1658111 RepID=UPI0006B50602|nr:S-layer homology domain-containing protein [Inediibacterium massiliense]
MKRYRWILFVSICISMGSALFGFANSNEVLKGHWAEKLIKQDFIKAHCQYLYDQNHFILKPDEEIYEEKFICSLYSILNKEYPKSYTDAIEYFVSKKIIQKDQVHIHKALDRKTAIRWMVDVYRQEKEIKDTTNIQNPFIDLNVLETQYKESILEAYHYGWVSGYADYTFRPNEKMTQIQAILLLERLEGELKVIDHKIPFHIIDKQSTNNYMKNDMIIDEGKEKVNITIVQSFPTPGYDIDVDKIEKNKNGIFNIYIRVEKPDSNVFSAQVLTSQMIKIEVNKKDLGVGTYEFDMIYKD